MKKSIKFQKQQLKMKIIVILVTIFPMFLITNALWDLRNELSPGILILILVFFLLLIGLIIKIVFKNISLIGGKNMQKIMQELDSDVVKYYENYGLYLTPNYLVCMGGTKNPLSLFAVALNDIDAINIYEDKSRSYRAQNPTWQAIEAKIAAAVYSQKSEFYVLKIICGSKAYTIATASTLNSNKINQMVEIGQDLAKRLPDVDLI